MTGRAGSRRKGTRFEKEAADVWRSHGFEVRGLEASGDHLCIRGDGLTLHQEAKRHERLRLPEWLLQAERDAPAGVVPVVAFRQSHGKAYAALALEDLARLLSATT